MSAIIRNIHEVQAIGFADGLDAYGQPQTVANRKRSIQMATYDYTKDSTEDVRMIDTILFGLTDEDVKEGEHIIDNHIEYYVTKVMNNGRHKQVYMRLA